MRNLLAILFISSFAFLAGCSFDEQADIEFIDAWVREAPPNATAMAGYVTIVNHTNQDKTLISANSSDFKVVEFHRSVEKNGVYRMVRHKQLVIPANGELELKPGDYHLMLITPNKALKEGDVVDVNIVLANDVTITHSMPVKKAVFE